MTSTAFKFSPDEILAQMQKNRVASSGPRTDWHKLEKGVNVVRFVTDGSVLPFLEYQQHRGVRDDGKFCTVVDLDWLFSPMGAAVLDASDLTAEDADLVGRYGSPVTQLRDALLPDDWKSEEAKAVFEAFKAANYAPQRGTGVMSVAVMEGIVGLLRLPVGVFNTVWEQVEETPSVLSPTEGADFKIKKSGQGLGTTYSVTLDVASLGTPVAMEEDASFPEPAVAVARDVIGYKDTIAFVRRSYPQFIPEGFVFGGEEN